MADPDDGHKIVEGDASAVPVRVAPGDPSDAPRRPSKGTQLVWGGADPSSPWGHLQSLIEAGGGSVQYTLLHSSVLAQLAQGKKPKPPPQQQQKKQQDQDPDHEKQHEKNLSYEEGSHTGDTHDLFDGGHDFKYDNKDKDARVWAHPAAALAGDGKEKVKVPLLVFLHGTNTPSPHPQLQDHPGEHMWSCHLGRLAGRLIHDLKVRPLAIAAPTSVADSSGASVWKVFDLSTFVQRALEELDGAGVKVDLDEVIVAGHSGAGCHGPPTKKFPGPPSGLYKIALEGAEFTDGKGGKHLLKVLGFADTCANSGLAKWGNDRLKEKKNDKTIIYAIHKGTGGGQDVDPGGPAAFAASFGATVPRPEALTVENAHEFDDTRDDGNQPPKRISLHLPEKKPGKHEKNDWDTTIFAQEKEWVAVGAIKAPWDHGNGTSRHYAVTMVWTWYALQRFWPPRAEDKKILQQYQQQQQQQQQQSKPDEHGEMERKEKEPERGLPGPDWDQVPGGPPCWQAPGGVRPKANLPLQFADPSTGRFWPVRTRSSYGRAVAFIGENGHGYGGGPASDATGQRHFLADRRVDDERWYNGGVDLYGDFGETVVASEEGTILRFEPLYSGVHKLLVRCTSGLVVHYGGVDPGSLDSFGLRVGDLVRSGQPVAHVGRMDGGQPMLHFETYMAGTKDIAACLGVNSASFLDPTEYLLNLAVRGL